VHVTEREEIHGHIAGAMREQPAEVPLGVGGFGEGNLAQREVVLVARRGSGLALTQWDRPAVFGDHGLELIERSQVIRIARVAVERDGIDQLQFALGLHAGQKPVRVGDIVGEGERPNLSRGLQLTDDRGGTNVKVDVGFRRRGVLAIDVRFVPHLPLVHPVPVTEHEGAGPGVPGRERLRRRWETAPEAGVAAARVEGIPVVEFQPRFYALRGGVIDNRVEPLPGVNALDLLALGPSGLQPDPLRAERSEETFEVVIDREIAIDRLGADRPRGIMNLGGRARGQLPQDG
jgi:hypothetical protein